MEIKYNPGNKFIDNDLTNDLYENVVRKVFPNMNFTESNILFNAYITLIDYIAHCFSFTILESTMNNFIKKLKYNDY